MCRAPLSVARRRVVGLSGVRTVGGSILLLKGERQHQQSIDDWTKGVWGGLVLIQWKCDFCAHSTCLRVRYLHYAICA